MYCQSQTRQWNDTSGKFSVNGSLLKAEKSEVTLLVDGKDEIQVPIENLCDQDQTYVRAITMLEQDDAQYRAVMEHSARFQDKPSSAIEILRTIHEDSPGCPYAAALLGIAHAEGRAEYVEAKKYLQKAARSIKKRQKTINPEYHKLTLTAVNNNLAVVSLKLAKGGEAIGLLRENFELTQTNVNFCSYHNAKLFLNVVQKGTSPIPLSSSGKRKLSKLLVAAPKEKPKFRVPDKLLYTSQLSQPMPRNTFEALFKNEEGKASPSEFSSAKFLANHMHPDVWCFQCRGTAVLKCPNLHCVRGEIEKRRPFLARVDPNTGKKFYGTERYFVRCPTCGGDDKLKCPHCVEGKKN